MKILALLILTTFISSCASEGESDSTPPNSAQITITLGSHASDEQIIKLNIFEGSDENGRLLNTYNIPANQLSQVLALAIDKSYYLQGEIYNDNGDTKLFEAATTLNLNSVEIGETRSVTLDFRQVAPQVNEVFVQLAEANCESVQIKGQCEFGYTVEGYGIDEIIWEADEGNIVRPKPLSNLKLIYEAPNNVITENRTATITAKFLSVTLATVRITLKPEKIPVTITPIVPSPRTYNGSPLLTMPLTATVIGLEDNDTLTFTIQRPIAIQAGTYPITITNINYPHDNTYNYQTIHDASVFVINKAPQTFQFLGANNAALIHQYFGAGSTATHTVTPSDSVSTTYIYSSSHPNIASVDSAGLVTAMGANSARVTISAYNPGNNNYNPHTATYTLEVNGATPQTTFMFNTAPENKVYGDDVFTHRVTRGESDGIVEYLSSSPTVATVDISGAVSIKNVGNTIISAEQKGNAIYTTIMATYSLTVSSKTITVTADVVSKIFGDSNPAFTYTAVGLESGDTLEGVLTSAGVDAGSHTISSTLGAPNYNIVFDGGNKFNITKKPIVITADNIDVTTAESVGFSPSAFSYTINPSSVTNLTGFLTRNDIGTHTVGAYNIIRGGLTDNVNPNYAITFNTGTYTIVDLDIQTDFKFDTSPVIITYGDTATAKVVGDLKQAIDDRVSDGPTTYESSNTNVASFETDRNSHFTIHNAGNTLITATRAEDIDKGVAAISRRYSLTVIPKTLTITANPATMVYGDNVPPLDYVITSGALEVGDSLTGALTTPVSQTTSVGIYDIISTLNNPNYDITFLGKNKLTITQRSIEVSVSPTATTRAYLAENPLFDYTFSTATVVNNDVIELHGALDTEATPQSDVGLYPVVQGTLAIDNPNYAANLTVATLSITPIPLPNFDAGADINQPAGISFTRTATGTEGLLGVGNITYSISPSATVATIDAISGLITTYDPGVEPVTETIIARITAGLNYLADSDTFTLTVIGQARISPFKSFINKNITGDIGKSYAVVALDIEKDGDTDIYVARFGQVNRLWINNGNNNFTVIDESTNSNSTGVIVLDADNDGNTDIYVTNNNANTLLLNDGSGSFTATTIAGDTGNSTGAVALDANNDGNTDIYVTRFGQVNRLWINNGNNDFTVIDESTNSNSTGVIALNANGDTNTDIYVTNNGTNTLLLNDGSGGGFTATTMEGDTGNSSGAVALDANNDGNTDIYVTNNGQNTLWINNAGSFTETTISDNTDNSSGAIALDANSDGNTDIYVANRPNDIFSSGAQNELWINDGFGGFTIDNISDDINNSYGATALDANSDGAIDIYVANNGQNKLWINNVGAAFTIATPTIQVDFTSAAANISELRLYVGEDLIAQTTINSAQASSNKAELIIGVTGAANLNLPSSALISDGGSGFQLNPDIYTLRATITTDEDSNHTATIRIEQ